MKSAYELALERLEKEGIERPRREALDDATREKMAEVRSKATAEIAQLEILHGDRTRTGGDSIETLKAEEEYLLDRKRIEERCERELQNLRGER